MTALWPSLPPPQQAPAACDRDRAPSDPWAHKGQDTPSQGLLAKGSSAKAAVPHPSDPARDQPHLLQLKL